MYEGLFLGILSFLGFWFIFRNFPVVIKKLISFPRFQWITDLLATIGIYLLLSNISSSFASAVGSAVTGILVSIYLHFLGDKEWNKKSQIKRNLV